MYTPIKLNLPFVNSFVLAVAPWVISAARRAAPLKATPAMKRTRVATSAEIEQQNPRAKLLCERMRDCVTVLVCSFCARLCAMAWWWFQVVRHGRAFNTIESGGGDGAVRHSDCGLQMVDLESLTEMEVYSTGKGTKPVARPKHSRNRCGGSTGSNAPCEP